MTIDRAVMMLMGIVVLISLALAVHVNEDWLWLAAFMGANLIQASITGFCPGAWLFHKMGMQPGCAFYSKKKTSCCCSGVAPGPEA